MFVLLTKGKEKSIISTPSTREANINNSIESHSLILRSTGFSHFHKNNKLWNVENNSVRWKNQWRPLRVWRRRRLRGPHMRVRPGICLSGWLELVLYNLLEFSLPLACVAGAKREGGGGGGEREPSLPNSPSLFSFLPIPYTPFDACYAGYLPLPLFVTPATQASSRMAF